jgi:hypothetical protein
VGRTRSRERAGREALLSTAPFRNRTSNLALVTQNVQWAVLLGTSFVVSAFLQTVRHYNAVQTGVIFTAATVGILLSSLAAGSLARRYRQRSLILAGFVITIIGIIVLLALVKGRPGAWYFAPGLFLVGTGVGVMLTPSVNVVQSAFPEKIDGRRPVSPAPRNVEGCLVDVGRGHRRGGVSEHARPPAGTRGHLEHMLASEPIGETGADGQQVALALWPDVHLVIRGCPVTVIILGSRSRIHAFKRIAGAVGQTGTGPPWLCTMAAPANREPRD